METTPENNKNGDLSLDKLKEALDKSSSINRALGLSFGIFVFVIAIMVASTTDLQLFIPDSTFNFPFINLPLGIVNFFLAAPFVVLIMHYNLLYNLMQHSKKLLNWHNAKMRFNEHEGNGDTKSEEDLDIYPFLFNFALNVKNPIHNRTLNIVNRITIFMLPLALLCFILFRFADYQSMPITFWHFAAVLLDAVLIATHSFIVLIIIKRHNEAVKEEYRFMEFFNFTKQGRGFKKQWKNAGTLIFTALPAFFATLFSLVITLIAGIWNLLTKLKFWKAGVFKSAISSQVLLYKYLRIETFMVHLATFFLGFFIYIMMEDIEFRRALLFPEMESFNNKLIYQMESVNNKLIYQATPKLSLSEEVLTKSQPEQQLIESHLNRNIDEVEREQIKQEIILEYSKGYSLKGRSFRYADFYKTILTKTDFRQADLTMANLINAKLQKTDFQDANLKGANLSVSNLQGANFSDFFFENLQGTYFNFSNVNLNGITFYSSNLEGGGFASTNLQGSMFTSTNLQGTNFTSTNLQVAYLKDVNLQGACLEDVRLQGAILTNLLLRGSIFSIDCSDTLLLIDEVDDTGNFIFYKDFERYLNIDLIPEGYLSNEEIDRLRNPKERYDNDTLNKTLSQRLPNAKIYRPKDLETDSTFFVIRRKIASESKEIAQGMLKSTIMMGNPVDKSLYDDLYKYLKAQHPDYLEGFKYDEEGELKRK